VDIPPGPREQESSAPDRPGLSNTQISATLIISEQTTKPHVSHILAKLNLRDRAQAVVVACETGLVPPCE